MMKIIKKKAPYITSAILLIIASLIFDKIILAIIVFILVLFALILHTISLYALIGSIEKETISGKEHRVAMKYGGYMKNNVFMEFISIGFDLIIFGMTIHVQEYALTILILGLLIINHLYGYWSGFYYGAFNFNIEVEK